MSFSDGSATVHVPLQEGVGSGASRHVYTCRSDGTGIKKTSAIVNGTIGVVWGELVPGQSRDWCIEYGGDIGADGEYVPGLIGGSNAADGTPKTLPAGRFGNPFSQLNLNPFTAAELNGRSIPVDFEVGDDLDATVTPADSAFARTVSGAVDRVVIAKDALTGSDLTDMENYVA
jgi:hypothetical protein